MRRANCLSVFALLKMRMQIVIFMKRYFDNFHYEKFADGRVKCIEDEIPFDLPDGWAWSRIKNISLIGTGATPLKSNSTYYKDGTIPWITSAATSKASITLPTDYITNLALAETNCTIYPVGTLIIAMYGEGKTRGQISELDIEACTNQACAALRVLGESKPLRQYVKLYFQYSYGSLRQKAKGGQQPNLNQTIIADTLIPIPPYKEIDRVIMFASDCFDLVDTIEEDKAAVLDGIGCIKKCILDLAIRGQLVPQDPADEPASVLLERIRAEKEELIKQGKIKRDKKESVIFRGEDNSYYEKVGDKVENISDEIPFELPDGWFFVRLKELWELISGRDLSPSEYNADGVGIPYITGASNFVDGKVELARWTTSPQVITEAGDLLLTCKGTIGGMAFNDFGNAHIARQIMAIRNTFALNSEYLALCMRFYINAIKDAAKGLIPGISREDILNLILPVPSPNYQAKIVERVAEVTNILSAIEKSLS